MDVREERLVRAFSRMHRSGGMVMIDQSMAYNIDGGADPATTAGILIKTHAIPKIQKTIVERVLELFTRKV